MSKKDPRAQYYWSEVKKHGSKYPQFHWSSVEALLNVVYTYDKVSTHMDQKIIPHGLSKATFSVLMILSRSESKACKQNEISQLMLVSRANITKLVDNLVKQGLVERASHRHDRRINMVKILPQGEELLKNLLPGYYQHVRQLYSALTENEKKTLNQLLTKLRDSIV